MSRHRMRWLFFRPEERARIPATSRGFDVRSRCSRDLDSGKNSASAMAPFDVRPVSERKSRLSDVLTVNAVRSADTCASVKGLPIPTYAFQAGPTARVVG